MELLVVLSVTVLLTGLLMPALSQVRENAHRVLSASNMRQLDLGVIMYTDNYNGRMPYTVFLQESGRDSNESNPQELMVAHLGAEPDDWDGIGLLYGDFYIKTPETFYCPSHRGEHPFERYEFQWAQQDKDTIRIYTNYHYCGHVDWLTGNRRSMDEGESLIVLTDGLRTKSDFNHRWGMNIARGDGSVIWLDNAREVYEALPMNVGSEPAEAEDYEEIWNQIRDLNKH